MDSQADALFMLYYVNCLLGLFLLVLFKAMPQQGDAVRIRHGMARDKCRLYF